MSEHIDRAHLASFIAFWLMLGVKTTDAYKNKNAKTFFTKGLPMTCIFTAFGYCYGYSYSLIHEMFPVGTRLVSSSFSLFVLGNFINNFCELLKFKETIESYENKDNSQEEVDHVQEDDNSQECSE